MNEKDRLLNAFEASRGRLRGIAYRMLGSTAAAEDAVQETWLRLQRADVSDVANMDAWLTTVVSRICLDVLRSRETRAEQPLGEESDVRAMGIDPAAELDLARSVGLALLVVLEELSPPERVAFVLHDLFDRPFVEIGPIIGKTEEAARQLASRARRRVQGAESPTRTPDVAAHAEIVEAFLAASRNGDLEKLVALLDPEVVYQADSAAMRGAPARQVRGAVAVSKLYRGRAQGAGLAILDGRPGIVVTPRAGELMLLIHLTFGDDDRIAAIDVTGDPARMRATKISVV